MDRVGASRLREIAEEEKAYTQRELARLPQGSERKPKWRIRVRLFTRSLTVRPKILSYWNDRVDFAQLRFSKKQEIILELVLRDQILLQDVWNAGLSAAQKFVVMLNIGTRTALV